MMAGEPHHPISNTEKNGKPFAHPVNGAVQKEADL